MRNAIIAARAELLQLGYVTSNTRDRLASHGVNAAQLESFLFDNSMGD